LMIDKQSVDGACGEMQGQLFCMPNNMGPFGSNAGDSSKQGMDDGFDGMPKPIFTEGTVKFEGKTWTHVGFRFKGNSTLMFAWGDGKLKLPFKLDFDEYEKTYPKIKDQRFFGFKKLAFTNNNSDDTYLREKIAGDLFREAGLKATVRSFMRVYIDVGEGPVYFGLYTMADMPSSDYLKSEFGSSKGNLYKPEGASAKMKANAVLDQKSFEKKNNKDSDWSDVKALVEALHDESRTQDAPTWRKKLEKYLNTDVFLKWLATNTVISNWDVYGKMTHNFYLYADPSDVGRLNWIPWDHNMALSPSEEETMDHKEVTKDWPLIRYLMDDEVYKAKYWEEVNTFLVGYFNEGDLHARIEREHNLIKPYVTGVEKESDKYTALTDISLFNSSSQNLKSFVSEQISFVKKELAKQ
jgi:spore coat protein H